MPQYNGKGGVYAMVTTATGTNLGTIFIQSIEIAKSANQIDLVDSDGSTKGRIIANKKRDLTVEGIYVGTSIADAKTQAAKALNIGDVITIADSDDADTVGAHSGKYLVTDVRKSKRNNAAAAVTFTMDQFADADITSTIS